MLDTDHIRSFLQRLASDPVIQQCAPLVVLFAIPAFILLFTSYLNTASRFYSAAMVFENLGLTFPWNWSSASSTTKPAHEKKHRKKGSKSVHSRAQQLAAREESPSSSEYPSNGYYPGLVNVSGTYCFMNATIQALASLSYLQPRLDAIHERAVELDVPTPIIDALQELFHDLNTPHTSYTSLRPMNLIGALSASGERSNALLCSRDHQDAQELFQLVSENIKKETTAVDKESLRDRGLGGFDTPRIERGKEFGKSVFDGLTANRRSCVECQYTEAVMHFSFDNWQLTVPRSNTAHSLEQCLLEYTRLELLTDCICRKCSMVATYKRLKHEAEKATEATKEENVSSSKKKRAREFRKLETRVRTALEEGRIEEDLKDIKMEKVFSKASTKQAMVARPPPVLALHLNRSLHYGTYTAKNTLPITFPEILDLTPFTTSGSMSISPSVPISSHPTSMKRSTTPTPASYASRTIYRLSSIVCHYGQHSFGHYICYRRKPRHPGKRDKRWAPPRLVADLLDILDQQQGLQQFQFVNKELPENIWEDDEDEDSGPGTGKGWLRISDTSVSEVGIENVLAETSGVFMLYYERVVLGHSSPYFDGSESVSGIQSSEETLKPQILVESTNSEGGFMTPRGIGVASKHSTPIAEPRIIRSVSTWQNRRIASPSPSLVHATPGSSAQPQENGDAHPQESSTSSTKLPNGNWTLLEQPQVVDLKA